MTNTRPIPVDDEQSRVSPELIWELSETDHEWGRRHAYGLLVALTLCIAGFWVPVIAVITSAELGR